MGYTSVAHDISKQFNQACKLVSDEVCGYGVHFSGGQLMISEGKGQACRTSGSQWGKCITHAYYWVQTQHADGLHADLFWRTLQCVLGFYIIPPQEMVQVFEFCFVDNKEPSILQRQSIFPYYLAAAPERYRCSSRWLNFKFAGMCLCWVFSSTIHERWWYLLIEKQQKLLADGTIVFPTVSKTNNR